MLGNGIFNTDGPLWYQQRKTASNIFNSKNFKDFTARIFSKEADLLVRVLDQYAGEGKEFDLQDVFFRFTLDTFTEIAFGAELKCLEATV